MKRVLTITVILCVVFVVSAQTPTATLSHQGKLTFFESGYALADAVKAAVAGDTIFLSEGDYYAQGFNLESYYDSPHIDKAITFVGTGRKTRIMDELRIKFSGDSVLTNALFDGVYLKGVEIRGSVAGLEFKKCHIETIMIRNVFNNNEFTYDESNTVKDIIIDRCYIGSFNKYYMDSPAPYSFKIYNSKIKNLETGARSKMDGLLYNCHVLTMGMYADVYFISCIVEHCYGGSGKNCLYGNNWTTTDLSENFENSKGYDTESDGVFFDENLELVDKYKNIEIAGADGTEIGIYGGATLPYSETPSMPVVDIDKSTFELDKTSNKLKVNVVVKSN